MPQRRASTEPWDMEKQRSSGRVRMTPVTTVEFVLHLVCACVLGGIVGLERQWHQRMAGTRTNALVAAGASAFGLHNPRHSLSTWIVNKGKVDPKTMQGMLRHSDIRTTMNLYTQDDRDEKQAAQGPFLRAVGLGSHLV